ncbi:hypothetical protein A2W54_00585 [Candidatus Giovannonibacteria bacterium RIFCSPHIGHO2_02_43_13]|uniref:Serine aminopeptidase S33 domain-containing protein n=1 Tax=Candidatus Giovannonibacteria bacterium RIFCSPHIGHO2_02_43_13 TaxID=1798330 RepID=A0A1F5WSA1_9BACT|nr:MAG: hypothetical protein A3E06_01605 [Candidatus Giovannonibacteria bacterium RIFCSPHIGHO2_12_FULL_44_42]OGF78497.1 MAG: hypothetical protein A2W54_00585 [Candidatus Giovannonibacteria bacterium RIFCSPHIGHO2_02_43_13]OGF89845.1 MAG: hypothetical protein A3I94_02595 [Candidatus Giovannonibacteria bacterium RIFCSPLOWO2_02_FULL_43_54]OGF96687.1 MAG: hypothetical protein A3H08_02175 [Candidatus Giovannonibacteria bacterium RIFCSPLOWO2_12_FULL_44_32]
MFAFVAFYILFGTIISIFQERIIYHPYEQDFKTCRAFESAEKIEFNGTRMYFKKSGSKLAVLYHGNAGSACDRSFLADIFVNSGYSFLVVEYAGYSNDGRKPSHDLIKNDVKNAVRFISSENFNEVAVIGESIGSGAAAYHAALMLPDKLMLISPFSNLLDMARSKFWYYPVFIMVDNAFDNLENLKNYDNRIVIIHGEKDDVIQYSLGQKLFLALPVKNKEFVTIAGAGHNDLFTHPEAYTAMYNFLK